MEASRTPDAEYTKLLAATRYSQHDLVVDGITLIAAVALVVIVLCKLGSK